jgi:aspartate 1-decarboxylase
MDPPKKSSKDDIIIIISYATLEFEEAKTFKP